MISAKFTYLISKNTDRLAERWAERVKKSEHMKAYQKQSHNVLKKRNQRFYENLVKWHKEGASHNEIKKYFARVGRERYHESIPLEEINFGFIIAKRVLWDFILSEGFFSDALAIYQALETLTMIYNFFDLGFFYISKEYMEEMYETFQRSNKFTDKELKDYLFPGTVITDKELESMFGISSGIK